MASNRPRLLYVLHNYHNRAGVELHVQALAKALQDRYEIAIVYPRNEQIHLIQADNEVACYPAQTPVWPITPFEADADGAHALGQILETFKPEIIHVQHFMNWPLSVIDQATASGAVVVTSFHDYYAITPDFAMIRTNDPRAAFTPAFAQATYGHDISPYLIQRRNFLHGSLQQVRARIVPSPYLKRQLEIIYPGDYHLIEYGITPFERLPASTATTGLRFGCVGTLLPQKGWQQALEAFVVVHQKHPTAELHFYGGGTPPPEHPPAGVYFHGLYNSEDLPRICGEFDVAVIPSRFAETFCMVLSEMWMAGLPVATSDIGALGERVLDGVNGKKFRPGDSASIAQALEWYLEHDEWRFWTMPRPKFLEQMVEEFDQLYKEVLPRSGTVSSGTEISLTSAREIGANLLIVQLCEFLDNGDGFYRFHAPSRALSSLAGVAVVEAGLNHRLLPRLFKEADVLILLGFDWDLFPLIEERRAAGLATVLEANDFYEDIQPWNPRAGMWQDRGTLEELRQCMEAVDAVQTSTPELARRWQKWARQVVVFPNQLEEVPPLAPHRKDGTRPLTIGWGGSIGHFADWYDVTPVLQKWLEAHPEVHIAVMTSNFARSFLRLPESRYRFVPSGSLTKYLGFLRSLDIGLAPLLPTEFNRCRSDVKFLEYAAHGVPGIYADLEPYRDTVLHGRTGLLYRTNQELVECLDRLTADVELRLQIRSEAHRYVVEHRRLAAHIWDRLTFYRSLVKAPPGQKNISAEVVAAADRAGNYLQLRPQEGEQMLAALMAAPANAETVQQLRKVIERYPNYLPAWQQHGKLLNDLRDHAGALATLEKALTFDPTSARTRCEIGRAHFMTGNHEAARQHLEAALTANPHYQLGWQYMLRLCELCKSADSASWAARAHAAHPLHLGLALTGVSLYPPSERLGVIQRLLEFYAPGIRPEEGPNAAAAFSQIIRDVVLADFNAPEVLPLLRRACEIFPQSARLADLMGRALHLAGHYFESREHYVRALAIRETAVGWSRELAKTQGTPGYWQFAEQIEKARRQDPRKKD